MQRRRKTRFATEHVREWCGVGLVLVACGAAQRESKPPPPRAALWPVAPAPASQLRNNPLIAKPSAIAARVHWLPRTPRLYPGILGQNETAAVVQSQYGIHVIRRTDRQELAFVPGLFGASHALLVGDPPSYLFVVHNIGASDVPDAFELVSVDLATGIHVTRPMTPRRELAISDDGTFVAWEGPSVLNQVGIVAQLNVAKPDLVPIYTLSLVDALTSAPHLMGDGPTLWAATQREVILVDLPTRSISRSPWRSPPAPPVGDYAVWALDSTKHHQVTALWNSHLGTVTPLDTGPCSTEFGVALAPEHNRMALSNSEGPLCLWQLSPPRELTRLVPTNHGPARLASPLGFVDGDRAVVEGLEYNNHHFSLWQLDNGPEHRLSNVYDPVLTSTGLLALAPNDPGQTMSLVSLKFDGKAVRFPLPECIPMTLEPTGDGEEAASTQLADGNSEVAVVACAAAQGTHYEFVNLRSGTIVTNSTGQPPRLPTLRAAVRSGLSPRDHNYLLDADTFFDAQRGAILPAFSPHLLELSSVRFQDPALLIKSSPWKEPPVEFTLEFDDKGPKVVALPSTSKQCAKATVGETDGELAWSRVAPNRYAVCDVKSGKVLHRITAKQVYLVDRRRVGITGKRTQFFDVTSGKSTVLDLDSTSIPWGKAAGDYFLVPSPEDGPLYLFSISGGTRLGSWSVTTRSFTPRAIDPMRKLALGTSGRRIQLRDLIQGNLLATSDEQLPEMANVTFGPGNLVVGVRAERLFFLDGTSLALRGEAAFLPDATGAVFFAPQGSVEVSSGTKQWEGLIRCNISNSDIAARDCFDRFQSPGIGVRTLFGGQPSER